MLNRKRLVQMAFSIISYRLAAGTMFFRLVHPQPPTLPDTASARVIPSVPLPLVCGVRCKEWPACIRFAVTPDMRCVLWDRDEAAGSEVGSLWEPEGPPRSTSASTSTSTSSSTSMTTSTATSTTTTPCAGELTDQHRLHFNTSVPGRTQISASYVDRATCENQCYGHAQCVGFLHMPDNYCILISEVFSTESGAGFVYGERLRKPCPCVPLLGSRFDVQQNVGAHERTEITNGNVPSAHLCGEWCLSLEDCVGYLWLPDGHCVMASEITAAQPMTDYVTGYRQTTTCP